jgi:hypothetical protein
MRTLIAKGLFRLARALRVTSYLIGACAAFYVVAAPFIASSFGNWLVLNVSAVVVAFVVYLLIYRLVPHFLARCAIAILPAGRKGYGFAELAIWDYENRHGSAPAPVRQEFHSELDDLNSVRDLLARWDDGRSS